MESSINRGIPALCLILLGASLPAVRFLDSGGVHRIPETGARPSGGELYVKVVRADEARQEVEVKLAIAPKETRPILAGDPKHLSAGDYAKAEFDGPEVRIGDVRLRSLKVIWKFE